MADDRRADETVGEYWRRRLIASETYTEESVRRDERKLARGEPLGVDQRALDRLRWETRKRCVLEFRSRFTGAEWDILVVLLASGGTARLSYTDLSRLLSRGWWCIRDLVKSLVRKGAIEHHAGTGEARSVFRLLVRLPAVEGGFLSPTPIPEGGGSKSPTPSRAASTGTTKHVRRGTPGADRAREQVAVHAMQPVQYTKGSEGKGGDHDTLETARTLMTFGLTRRDAWEMAEKHSREKVWLWIEEVEERRARGGVKHRAGYLLKILREHASTRSHAEARRKAFRVLKGGLARGG